MGTIFYKASEDSEFFKKGDSISLTIAGEPGEVSDGYHTFNELYEHRCLLFCMLLTFASHQDTLPMGWDLSAWKSLKHSDGSSIEGWFIAGLDLGDKQITYHLPIRMFNDLQSVETLTTAPEWDGHTSQDVIERLKQWLKAGRG